MNPPPDWRNRIVRMYADIRQDGSVADVKLVGSSGSDSLDAAALAQVRKTWRWAPLVCGRPTAGQDIVMAIPRARCVALSAPGSRPQPPLALAQPRRGVRASLDVTVGEDGYVAKARIDESSGNAALDAALLNHVFQTWHFWPLAEGCAPDTEHYLVRFPEADCITRPIPASQTLPAVAPQRQTRAVDLQIVVAPDGRPLSANVAASSGDAGLDAAAIAHVKAAWRWEPIACKRVVSYLRGTALPVMDMVRVVFPAS